MNIVDQLNLVAAALAPIFTGLGGLVIVCGQQSDIFAALQAGPLQPMAYPSWLAETAYDDFSDRTGMMKRTFRVVITRGKGMTLNPADSLVKDTPAAPAMFNLFEQVRDAIRAVDFADPALKREPMDPERYPFSFDSGLWQHGDTVYTDILKIDFAIAAQI